MLDDTSTDRVWTAAYGYTNGSDPWEYVETTRRQLTDGVDSPT
ncbi:MAG TPA: hypothetical protein VIT21_01205 [Chthoniobacterales bacterium]